LTLVLLQITRMKKQLFRFIYFALLFLIFFNGKAQVADSLQQNKTDQQQKPEEKEPEKPKKCIKKFKSLTDTYYGVPNLYGFILAAEATNENSLSKSFSNIGPTGAKYEFLITDNFGLGVDANYAYSSITWKEKHVDANNNPVTYSYKATSGALRSMLGFNFHYATKKRVDWYSAFKVGYFSRTFSYTSDAPNYIPPSPSLFWNWWHPAFRLETGVRLFIAPFLAVNFNIGLGGGPLIAGGVSSKF
jgi:hypothetical protein